MDANTQIIVDSIQQVRQDVLGVQQDTTQSSRDVSQVKGQVVSIQDQLDAMMRQQRLDNQRQASLDAQNQRDMRLEARRQQTADHRATQHSGGRRNTPLYMSRQGASTLMGVSLNEMALRIRAQSPGITYAQARAAAQKLTNANQTLTTGGGSFFGNAKRGVLQSVLGNNLGTKASRFLTSKSTRDRAASTLVNFDARNAAGQAAERQEPKVEIVALQQQVTKLTEAVKENTAVKVQQLSPKKQPVVKEDLSEAVAALKVLGFDMKEIKDRLSSVPRGLSTEDRIKHALKSPNQRLAARDAAAQVQKQKEEMANKPRMRLVDGKWVQVGGDPIAAPAAAAPVAPQTATPVTPSTPAEPVNAVRGPVPQDQLDKQTKDDKATQEKREGEEENVAWHKRVMSELHIIEDGIKAAHSESFIALLAMALAAAVAKYWEPIKAVISSIWNTISSVFKGIENLSDWLTTKLLDWAGELMPSDKTKNKIGGMIDATGHALGKFASYLPSVDPDTGEDLGAGGPAARAEMDKEYQKSSTIRANKEKLWKETGTDSDAALAGFPRSYDEAVKRHMPRWIDENYESHYVINRKSDLKSAVPDKATKLDQQSSENSQLKDDRTSSIMLQPVVMPTQQTVVPGPGGGGGGGAQLALLDGRNSEPSSGGYLQDLFDHPATHGRS